MERERLSNIQVLRFIAAASVLTKHTLEIFFPPTIALLRLPWNGGVDLFFVISGFIMAWLGREQFGQPGAAGRFLARRAIRIIPAYWFFTLLMVALLAIAPQAARNTVLGLSEVVTSLLFIPWPRPTDGIVVPLLSQGWTLNYEAFFYLCFSLALLLRNGRWLLIVTFLGLATAGALADPKSTFGWFYTRPIILEFAAGILLESIHHRGLRLRPLAIAACLAAAIAAYLAFPGLPMNGSRLTDRGLSAILIAAAFILARQPAKPGPLRRALSLGGDASYTIYLSHPFTINATAVLFSALGLRLSALGAFLAFALSIGFAALFYFVVEKPVTKSLYRRAGFSTEKATQMVAP